MLPWQTPLRQTSLQCVIVMRSTSDMLIDRLWRYASMQLSRRDNLVDFGQKCRCYGGRRHSQGKHSRSVTDKQVSKTLRSNERGLQQDACDSNGLFLCISKDHQLGCAGCRTSSGDSSTTASTSTQSILMLPYRTRSRQPTASRPPAYIAQQCLAELAVLVFSVRC